MTKNGFMHWQVEMRDSGECHVQYGETGSSVDHPS